MIKIFITGGTGFIGAPVARYLCEHGYDVVALWRGSDIQQTGDSITWVRGDLAEKVRLVELLSIHKPDVILHIAGLTPHGAPQDDLDYRHVNVGCSTNLLNAMLEAQKEALPKFIYASTVGVYGVPACVDGMVDVCNVPAPQSAYAQSKLDFENLLQAQTDVPYAILRYSNIPGRDTFISACMDGKNITLHGDEPYVRDYIHMDDLCALHDKTIQYLITDGDSVTLNAGSGIGVSFADIIDEVGNQTKTRISVSHAPARKNDVVRVICDIQSTKDALDWAPTKTNLRDIISYALDDQQLLS